MVLWRHTPDGEAYPAVVTSAGRSAISVMVFPPDSRGGLPKTGVLHAGDPRLKGHTPDADAGCWDFTDESKLLRSLAEQLGAK
jgi:hypothetical protein